MSDSLLPVTFNLWLDRCPTTYEVSLLAISTIVCAATVHSNITSVFAAVSGADGKDAAASYPAHAVACTNSALESKVYVSAVALAGVYFRAAQSSGALTCRISDPRKAEPLMYSSLPLEVSPTMWPLWDDAIVLSASGLMRAAYLGTTVNATGTLLRLAENIACNYSSMSVAYPNYDAGGIAASLDMSWLVLAAARDIWGGAVLPNASSRDGSSSRAFTLTLSGASRIVLRGGGGMRSFTWNATSARLGAAICNISAISDDGAWAVLDTPTSERLCGSTTQDCGYMPFVLNNAPCLESDRTSAACLGAELSCPPFCAGAVDDIVIPIATADGGFTLGTRPPTALGALPSPNPPMSASSSAGVYYAVACAQTGLWTDPVTGACTNATDPLVWVRFWRCRRMYSLS